MGRTCKFKSDDNTVVKYFPGDIIAYRFIDGKYYISRESMFEILPYPMVRQLTRQL